MPPKSGEDQTHLSGIESMFKKRSTCLVRWGSNFTSNMPHREKRSFSPMIHPSYRVTTLNMSRIRNSTYNECHIWSKSFMTRENYVHWAGKEFGYVILSYNSKPKTTTNVLPIPSAPNPDKHWLRCSDCTENSPNVCHKWILNNNYDFDYYYKRCWKLGYVAFITNSASTRKEY